VIRCGQLPTVANAKVQITKSSYGGFATWSCDEGYYLSGVGHRFCTAEGKWSQQNPECISRMHCDAFADLANGHIIYATDKGQFNQSMKGYPFGTLAEFQCSENYALTGENLINCLDNGQWDVAAPSCEPVRVTSHSEVLRRFPTKNFWINIRDYLFHSCHPKKVSRLCQNPKLHPTFDDLSDFEAPDTEEFQHMDQKLLSLLKKADHSPELPSVAVEQFFDFLLYSGEAETTKMSEVEENSHRLVLCIYIDILTMDRDLTTGGYSAFNDHDNINETIKYYLKKVMLPIYENFLKREQETHRAHSNAILRLIASKAQELSAEKERNKAKTVVKCELPVLPENTPIIPLDLQFSYSPGERIEYRCDDGSAVPSGPVVSIQCLPTGQWTELTVDCAKT
jgi:Sushi repeat (SCR repeat)